MLGIREPDIYGRETYDNLCDKIESYCLDRRIRCELFQSNCEGELVDAIQSAYFEKADGIIINPGAYTHTSVAILDAVKAVGLPTVEVHISDPDAREDFRRISYVRSACIATVKGHGTMGYLEAVDILRAHIKG